MPDPLRQQIPPGKMLANLMKSSICSPKEPHGMTAGDFPPRMAPHKRLSSRE